MTVNKPGQSIKGIPFFISSGVAPVLVMRVPPQAAVLVKSAALAWVSEGVSMAKPSRSGIDSLIKSLLGQKEQGHVLISAPEGGAEIGLASVVPSQIIPIDLGQHDRLRAHQDTILAADASISIIQPARQTIFSSAKLHLSTIVGTGTIFTLFEGNALTRTLADGEHIRIREKNLALMDESVGCDIIGDAGSENPLLSLRGPGRIWIQTMPMSILASTIASQAAQLILNKLHKR